MSLNKQKRYLLQGIHWSEGLADRRTLPLGEATEAETDLAQFEWQYGEI